MILGVSTYSRYSISVTGVILGVSTYSRYSISVTGVILGVSTYSQLTGHTHARASLCVLVCVTEDRHSVSEKYIHEF